jgi:hypothetical protein
MAMDDVECPYCEKYFDVDYCEREQGETFEHSCPHCGKMVFITLEFMPTFDIYKAPCLNGGEHDWYKTGSKLSFHGEYEECLCGETKGKISDKEAWEKQEIRMKEIKNKDKEEIK